MGLLTGSIFFGWAALAQMILKSECFSTMCPKDAQGHFINDGRANGQVAICDAQEAAVQHLYPITLFTMTSVSLIAGTMMDALGPRSTAILGYCLNIAACICLAASHWGGDVFLYVGFILLGAATDMAFLPLLCSARLFQDHCALIICMLGSSASASFGVPPILEAIAVYMKLHRPLDIFWGYALAGPGICLVLAGLFLPNTGFLDEDPQAQPPPTQQRYEELLDAAERDLSNVGVVKPLEAVVERQGHEEPDSAWAYVCSVEYLLVAIYFAVFSCAVVFYQEAPGRYFSTKVVKALEAALPLSFIPCAVLGWVADACGVVPAMAIVTANGIVAYACALWGTDFVGYISVFCFTNFIAIFTSQIFVYTGKRFPPCHFGKVIGSLQLLGGALALICNPLYSAVAVYHVVSLEAVTRAFIGVLVAQYVWLFWLWRLHKEDEKPSEDEVIQVMEAPLRPGK